MLNTHFQGKTTEMKVALAFLQKGYQVSQPLVSDSRYDFIIDINNKLLKIQVKTCRIFEEEGYIDFATSTSHTNTQGTVNHSYSEKEIDYFATIYNNECYLIPFSEIGSSSKKLRLLPTKNGQVKNICFAKDYIAKEVLERR